MVGLKNERYKESELEKPKAVKSKSTTKKDLARKKKPKEKTQGIM